jgi:integrase/recombinase XerD
MVIIADSHAFLVIDTEPFPSRDISPHEEGHMTDIRWEYYPLVSGNQTARVWLQIQANLQLRPNTVDAYGRGLNDYLDFCARNQVKPETITREQFSWYVHDLATRPNPKGANILTFGSGRGLSNSTLQQRITVVRLYQDYLAEQQIRPDTPVRRGYYVAGKSFGGARQRGEIPAHQTLPWIPSDEEWRVVLASLKQERLRNQVMLCLSYDGALRREELVTLSISDLDVAYRQARIRAEHAKNGRERVVGYGTVTSRLLEAYLRQRRELSLHGGPVFLSESHHHFAGPLSLVMWSKVVQNIACRTGLPRFTTHTPRHLRLTHMARAKMDLNQIAAYAGHRSIQTSMQYIHLSGVELTDAVAHSLAGFEQWMTLVLGDTVP